MPRDMLLPTYIRDQPYLVDGEMLNILSRHAHGNSAPMNNDHGYTRLISANAGECHDRPYLFGIAQVTDDSDDGCDQDDGDAAPCGTSGRYICKLYYYDLNNNGWVEFDEEIRLDMTPQWGSPGLALGALTPAQLNKGDRLFVQYDNQRGMWLPQGSVDWVIPGIVAAGGISARSGLSIGYGPVDLYDLDTTVAAPVMSDRGEQAVAFNISTATMAEGDYVILDRDRNGNLWVIVQAC